MESTNAINGQDRPGFTARIHWENSRRHAYQMHSLAQEQSQLKANTVRVHQNLVISDPHPQTKSWVGWYPCLHSEKTGAEGATLCKTMSFMLQRNLTRTVSFPDASVQCLLSSAEIWFLAQDQPPSLPSLFLLCPHTQANRVHISSLKQ